MEKRKLSLHVKTDHKDFKKNEKERREKFRARESRDSQLGRINQKWKKYPVDCG